jgi:predicted Fe-Mo cluster-binding NifX family protein
MKIAVASSDGASVSQHLGRSACFIVYEVIGQKVAGHEVRQNTFTAFAKGDCHGHEQGHHDQPHSHASMIDALRDCDVLLCQGMGWRAAEELQRCGIQPVVFSDELAPEEAVLGYLAGSLNVSGGFCRCHE